MSYHSPGHDGESQAVESQGVDNGDGTVPLVTSGVRRIEALNDFQLLGHDGTRCQADVVPNEVIAGNAGVERMETDRIISSCPLASLAGHTLTA